ncbi:PocR ligand-binding domain-containing protein [Clostridium grantii]|uniref:AraC-type DNA-binding protein n=1 Tax=Clostridium grantii DSM 8605 TaxID=1121316 RepID=A0A1M5TN62_9CLOT|nr:PocR ligand-binding domain-containing protein [Clostridium grantii]SHH52217.1 AraC-type DNA-binding protein [Clostridium grantii DSM 8605]
MLVEFNEKNTIKLLEDYYSLVGVGIGLYDQNYQPLYLVPEKGKSFCQLIRENPEVMKACRKCDMDAFKIAEKTKDIYIYKCHMGLYEAVAPVLDEEVVVGFIMIGQVLSDVSINTQWERVENKCKNYDLVGESYKDYFYTLERMSIKKIEAVTNIMLACAAYIWFKKIVHVQRGSLFFRIDTFIKENLENELTQEVICKKINIGRTTLYNCLKRNVSMSLTNYIMKLRLEKARELLERTDLKVRDVALKVGIADYNYFSRVFKKRYEITPREFRLKISK